MDAGTVLQPWPAVLPLGFAESLDFAWVQRLNECIVNVIAKEI